MRLAGSTPEELESLLEDALILGDSDAVVRLFDERAVLIAEPTVGEARGAEQIARLATAMCERGYAYLADPGRIMQAGDITLVVAERAINVMRRRPDGNWRYAISLISTDDQKEEPMTKEVLEALAVSSGEGEARWWFGQLAEIKATAADTGGRLTIVEVTCAPGFEAPLHVHHREDEAFWILEGDVTLYVGEQTIGASTGDYAFGPRDIPHRYSVGAAGCRMLFICTPGGFEGLVRDMSEPAATRTLPPPAGPPDMEWVRAIAKRHGCELLV